MENATDELAADGRSGNVRRKFLRLMLAGGAAGGLCSGSVRAQETTVRDELCNPLLWVLAYKQTAAEYFALCHQAYNLARMRIDLAISARTAGGRRLAVITDMDNTILHATSYWGHLVNENRDFFDDAIWDKWLPNNLITAVPGARDFFTYCKAQGVEVFYVTNRNQGESTFDYALGHLQHLEMPFADAEHLIVFRESSDKTPARLKVEASFEVALMLGDNLNDFRRDYYVTDVAERRALMERDRDDWGTKFVLVPNPTDGHWVRAIFGDSEPAPTDENRRILRRAATRVAWDGLP